MPTLLRWLYYWTHLDTKLGLQNWFLGFVLVRDPRAGVGVFIDWCQNIAVYRMDERGPSLHLGVDGWVLTIMCAHAPNCSSEQTPILESLDRLLESWGLSGSTGGRQCSSGQ